MHCTGYYNLAYSYYSLFKIINNLLNFSNKISCRADKIRLTAFYISFGFKIHTVHYAAVCKELQLTPALQGPKQGNLVGIFQVAAYRYAIGKSCNLYSQGL